MPPKVLLRGSIAAVLLSACGARSGLDVGRGGSSSVSTTLSSAASSVSSSVSSSASSSSTGTGGCSGFIDVTTDKVAGIQHFTAGCPGGMGSTAFGYLYFGPGNKQSLTVQGCASDGTVYPGISLVADHAMTVGTYGVGTAKYTLNNNTYSSNAFKMNVTALGPVGGAIDGTFALGVTGNGDSFQLTGTFHVCRTPDFDAP